MFTSVSHIDGAKLTCNDGDLGRVHGTLLDVSSWTLRYLLVDAGSWANGNTMCLPMMALPQPIGSTRHLHVDLSRNQVRSNTDTTLDESANRMQEQRLLRHYRLPDYWEASTAVPSQSYLCQSAALLGCAIDGNGISLGTVKHLVFDDRSWILRYLVVDTSGWWQDGHRVLIGMQWTEPGEFIARKIQVGLSRDQVRASPSFAEVASIHREYELRLHRSRARIGYWV